MITSTFTPPTHKRHILVIEDDIDLCTQITTYFTQRQYQVSITDDTNHLLHNNIEANYDCILLGITTSPYNALRFIQQLRQYSGVPLIIISTQHDQSEKIVALHLGADDYLCQPLHFTELDARITAILRRIHTTTQTWSTAYIQLDTQNRSVFVDGKAIDVTSMEFTIISTLLLSPGRVFSRKELTLLVNHEPQYMGRAIDVHISNIRAKIEPNPDTPIYIVTIYGKGYMYQLHPKVPARSAPTHE